MTDDSITINPAVHLALFALAARTGRTVSEVLAAAVEEYRQRVAAAPAVESIPGVNPAEVWEAAAEAEAGLLTSHADLFARLRNRA